MVKLRKLIRDCRRYNGAGAVVSLLYGVYTELGRESKPRREIHAKAGQ